MPGPRRPPPPRAGARAQSSGIRTSTLHVRRAPWYGSIPKQSYLKVYHVVPAAHAAAGSSLQVGVYVHW